MCQWKGQFDLESGSRALSTVVFCFGPLVTKVGIEKGHVDPAKRLSSALQPKWPWSPLTSQKGPGGLASGEWQVEGNAGVGGSQDVIAA